MGSSAAVSSVADDSHRVQIDILRKGSVTTLTSSTCPCSLYDVDDSTLISSIGELISDDLQIMIWNILTMQREWYNIQNSASICYLSKTSSSQEFPEDDSKSRSRKFEECNSG